MADIEIKPTLYLLYLLHVVYKDEKELSAAKLNSLQLRISNNIDKEYNTKEKLINLTNSIVRDYFKVNMKDNFMIEFKIGEVIKTDFSSSLIVLKFIFDFELFKCSIFENNTLIETVNVKNKM